MGDSQEEAQSCTAKPSPRLADLLSEELLTPGGTSWNNTNRKTNKSAAADKSPDCVMTFAGTLKSQTSQMPSNQQSIKRNIPIHSRANDASHSLRYQ